MAADTLALTGLPAAVVTATDQGQRAFTFGV
jgi:hypothetical protein